METFLEFVREVIKGIIRAISAHLFEKTFLDERKPPNAVESIRVVLKKIKFDNQHPDGRGCRENC